jgi:predicted Zn-dependent protease
MAMLLEPSAGTGPVDQIGPAQMAQAGWQQVSGQRSTINGLDAYIGTYTGVSNGTAVTAVAAHVRANDHVYVVAGVAPTASFTEADQAFRSAIDSFRTLSRADADRIQPNRVDFYVVRPGDTWTSIARDACRGTIDATTLAIMNGHDRAAVPRAGDRIRVVVGG